jgi:hypothetical protein
MGHGSFPKYSLGNFMSHISRDPNGQIFAGRHMREVQAKWDRLSMSDLAQIKTKAELIARVEQHYSLPHNVAAQDVEIWDLAWRL